MQNNQNNQTILVVEDDVSLLAALVDKLTREGYSVLSAPNGREGLTILFKNTVDLILLDIMMPEMDGISMMKEVRKKGTWGKKVPIIFLTNVDPNDSALKKIKGGETDYYLIKINWTMNSLVAKIRECLKYT